tara:strand:+ start:6351 stop:6662 length:312 start_codon:yes stop_codon:yes gene_type:complete
MTGFYRDYNDVSGVYTTTAKAEAEAAAASAAAAAAAAATLSNPNISDIVGLVGALDNKVDDPQVLTNVPLNAVFTDTTYTYVSSFTNDSDYLTPTTVIDAGNF